MTLTTFDTTQTPTASVGYQNINNILINGGFEFWQRGTTFGPPPTNNTYTADRWKFETNEAAGITISQESTTIDSGTYSMKTVITSAGASTQWDVSNVTENVADYRGKTIILSIRVKTTVAGKIRAVVTDNFTTNYSSYHTGSGNWETLTSTLPVNAAATVINTAVGGLANGDKAAGTYYFDSAMLVIGSTAVNFVPKNYQTELAQCQRYYQRFGGHIALEEIAPGQAYTTVNWYATVMMPTPMRVAPTLTVNNPTNFNVYDAAAAVKACATVVANTQSAYTFNIAGTVASGLVAGNATRLETANINAVIEASAEL